MRRSIGGKIKKGIKLFDQEINIGSTLAEERFMNKLLSDSDTGFSNANNSHIYLVMSFQFSVLS